MFQVWGIDGIQRDYVRGVIRAARIKAINHDVEHKEGAIPPNYQAALAHYQGSEQLESRPAVLAKDIMSTPVLTITLTTRMAEVSAIMTVRRYRHLPILNDAKLPVGIISDRDVMRSAIGSLPQKGDFSELAVAKFMTKELLTAAPEATIREVARVMFDEHIGAVPVVNSDTTVLGIITRSDILRALLKHAPLKLWV